MGEAAEHTFQLVIFRGVNATIKQYLSKCSLKRIQNNILGGTSDIMRCDGKK